MGGEIAAHDVIVDPGAVGDPVNVTDATPFCWASERAASTIAATHWRFFSSVRARWTGKLHHRPKITHMT